MVQLLSRSAFLLLFALLAECVWAQPTTGGHTVHDYKDRESHENFRKRRKAVAAWQINQLKQGALVVRLKTSQMLINALLKKGDDIQAEKKRLEQAAINVNMIKAFTNYYKFSKVYFIFSNSSDSLLQGTRSGIFIDTSLRINPSIKLTEDFYLIAETDFVYSSTIGFIPESSALKATERGTPSSMEYPIVFKNKYGHQLKEPFPVNSDKYLLFKESQSNVVVTIYGVPIGFDVNSPNKQKQANSHAKKEEKALKNYTYKGQELNLIIPREMTYSILSEHVMNVNGELERFYRSSAGFSENSKNYEDSKPFFY